MPDFFVVTKICHPFFLACREVVNIGEDVTCSDDNSGNQKEDPLFYTVL
jgi:hypothetical protein